MALKMSVIMGEHGQRESGDGERWWPARYMQLNDGALTTRLRDAWLVFRGHAEAVEWDWDTIYEKPIPSPGPGWWRYKTRVRKPKGSAWQGIVVGFYTTSRTPEGYAVESDAHPGSVQIYPRQALELVAKPDNQN